MLGRDLYIGFFKMLINSATHQTIGFSDKQKKLSLANSKIFLTIIVNSLIALNIDGQ